MLAQQQLADDQERGLLGLAERSLTHRGRAMSGEGEAFIAFDTSKEEECGRNRGWRSDG